MLLFISKIHNNGQNPVAQLYLCNKNDINITSKLPSLFSVRVYTVHKQFDEVVHVLQFRKGILISNEVISVAEAEPTQQDFD